MFQNGAGEDSNPYRAVFIRAPGILECGKDVEVLSGAPPRMPQLTSPPCPGGAVWREVHKYGLIFVVPRLGTGLL